MKDISKIKKSKDVITGHSINKESVYYICLFGAAVITALILLIIAYIQRNSGLKIYSWILLPFFSLCTAIAARYTYVGKSKIYVLDGVLVIKSFFATRKFRIEKIEKLTSATNNKDGVTALNIGYKGKVINYKFKTITKEEIAHLRHATSKH